MRRALQSLISLYPRAWRHRYQDEFNALLDDVSPTWKTFFDVLGGALKMQMKSWSAWKTVAAFAAVGVLGAAAFTMTIPRRYVSTAVIKMRSASDHELIDSIERVESRSSLTELIVEQNLYASERARIPIEDVIEHMKRQDILIRPIAGQSFAVSFSAADAGQAQRTTERLASKLVDGDIGVVVDPARLPVAPVGPRLSKNLVMGLIAGVVLGSLYALFAGLRVWKLAAGLGVAGAIGGAAIGYLLPERFGSTAVMRVVSTDQAAAFERVRQLFAAVTSGDSLHAIVQKFNLYPGESGRERTLREHLRIAVMATAPAFSIQFDDKNRYTAQKVTADVVSRFMEGAIHNGPGLKTFDMTLELLDPPSLSLDAFSPNRAVVVGVGLFIGLAAAVGLGVRRYFRAPLPAGAAR